MLRFGIMIMLGVLSWSCLSQEGGSSSKIKEISDKTSFSHKLCLEGKREEAKAVLLDLEKWSAQELGRDTIQYALALSMVAGGYSNMGEPDRAMQLFAVSNRFVAHKPHQSDSLHAINLRELARIHYYQRNYDTARITIGKALETLAKQFGKSSADHAMGQLILANMLADLGDYRKAISLAEESRRILETTWGTNHPEYANALTVLAKAKSYLGDYAAAEKMLVSALQIQERLHEVNHLDHARSLVTLANVYVDNGNYDGADSLFSLALTIEEQILGKQNLEYASVLSDYALLLRLTGQFDKAEPALLHDKWICELKLGKGHLDYSTACNNLALFYDDVGDYEKAEALLTEAMEITENVLGKESPDYSTLLNNLGYLYRKTGLFSKAVRLHLEEIQLCNRLFGRNHPDCVSSLFHLAEAYSRLGEHRSADSLFADAIPKWRRISGKWNPEYARSLHSYGQLQMAEGNWNRADSLLAEAKSIQEKILGMEHPDYLATCISLSELYERQNKWRESEMLQVEIKKLQLANMAKSVSYLSVNEMAKFIRSFEQTNDFLYSYMAHRLFHGRPMGLLTDLAFDYLLFYKGFLLSSASKLNVLAGTTMESKELNRKRKMYFRLLAKEYIKPAKERDQKVIDELQDKANAIEKELIRNVSGFSRVISQVHWREVGAQLKSDEAVIEFVSFQKRFPFISDSILYAAAVLKSGDPAPEFIILCEQKSVDSILLSGSGRKSDYVNGLYSLLDRGAVAVESPKRSLYDLFWKPMEARLNGISRIYFSPSGLLHRINLGAIPVSETEVVSDRYALIQLNSTRQLVISDQMKVENSEVVLYGGIYFDRDTALKSEAPVYAMQAPEAAPRSGAGGNIRGEGWSYLPGTAREVGAIENIAQFAGWQVRTHKAYEATEDSFKRLSAGDRTSPRIIHMATHGYFFPDQRANDLHSTVNDQSESVISMNDHPMLRSGLIMSGGNATWGGKQVLEGLEDGILTAYEISQMNLSNTELVVLSACETGLGDIQGNEGVYGLQRAFKIAGVKYMIMSLWQVPDKQTSLLMISFYKKWLEFKMSIPDAFHAAQKELRDNGLDPYNWAGFVLVE